MIAKNPLLQNLHRPAYELPVLIKNLGDLSRAEPLTEEQSHLVNAIAAHAANSSDRIACGLESIGQLLYVAGASENSMLERHLCGIGELVSYLAVQLQHLHDTESDMAVFAEHGRALKMKGGAK